MVVRAYGIGSTSFCSAASSASGVLLRLAVGLICIIFFTGGYLSVHFNEKFYGYGLDGRVAEERN
jgi:hypothetical protein